MKQRLEALAAALPEDLEGAMIDSPINRRYYTGFPSSAGVLLVSRRGCVLIIDSRYHEAASRAVEGCQVILQDKLYDQIVEQCGRLGIRQLGVENDQLTLGAFATYEARLGDIQLIGDKRLSGLIGAQRRRKSPREIDSIRRAQAITDDCFLHILDYIKPGRTEREIALEIEFYTRKHGSERNAFEVIAVSGVNSSMPHGVPGDKPLERGDLLTMDFGCVVDGYSSDMTRTVAIGEPGEEQRRVYDTVLAAQLAALDAMRAGARCRDVDAAARTLIDQAGYQGLFGHGLGHSLGLEVHENPRCNHLTEEVLEEGMLMTSEPGIYLPGRFGVRIEDLVVVTADGHDNLTKSTKELQVL